MNQATGNLYLDQDNMNLKTIWTVITANQNIKTPVQRDSEQQQGSQ